MATKYRNWQYIFYPESWPTWYEDQGSLHVPSIAIIHNRDLKEDGSGEFKKEHGHSMLQFEGPVSESKVRDMLSPFPIPMGQLQPVNSLVGSCRYFFHLDDPDKALYSLKEGITFCGGRFHIDKAMSADEVEAIQDEILRFVRECNMNEYADLIDYCQDYNRDWFNVARKQSVFWTKYMASSRARVLNNEQGYKE